jgi:hypothetical protein
VDAGTESSVALIEHCYQPIFAGDFLVDYEPATDVWVNAETVLPSLSAWVIGIQDPDMDNAYVAEVIYLDKGYSDDLSPGDVFYAYRYGDVQSSPGDDSVLTLDVPIAEVVVVTTESTTSAALVSGNVTGNVLQVGDRLHLVRRQQS